MSLKASSFIFLLITLSFLEHLDALRCYQCNTTWEMGCYTQSKIPEPGVDPKHLKECKTSHEESYCLKEFYNLPKVHYGFTPFVNRTCGIGVITNEYDKTSQILNEKEGCYTYYNWKANVENKTYFVDRTICKCSVDNCNKSGRSMQLNTFLFLILINSYVIQVIKCVFVGYRL